MDIWNTKEGAVIIDMVAATDTKPAKYRLRHMGKSFKYSQPIKPTRAEEFHEVLVKFFTDTDLRVNRQRAQDMEWRIFSAQHMWIAVPDLSDGPRVVSKITDKMYDLGYNIRFNAEDETWWYEYQSGGSRHTGFKTAEDAYDHLRKAKGFI